MVGSRDFAIHVSHVTKSFRVHLERNRSVKEKVLYAGRARYRDFVALRDVSLEVPKGQTLGLIGVNGSGKSTLLKLMSRILYPDRGEVEVRGRVSSLLELGSGFHPDFTGRENVFLNGALLGLSKKEIAAKLDGVIEFSELGDFIDEPVRSYSSGMYMRLAFSVAVAVDPEILLIDEILAVGDAAFQAKCMSRIRELRAANKTIVLVTHDTGAVERFCDAVVWMHNSRVEMSGGTVDCIQAYLAKVFHDSNAGVNNMSFDREDQRDETEPSAELSGGPVQPEGGPRAGSSRWGSGEVTVDEVLVRSNRGGNLVECGEPVEVRIRYTCHRPVEDVDFGVGFFSEDDVQCYGVNTRIDRHGCINLEVGSGEVRFVAQHFYLLPATYKVDVAINAADTSAHDYWRSCAVVQVYSDRNDVGICRIPHEWSVFT